jgi:homoserine dehydrogenase
MTLASENGVCYRFEASVGGGIPVISPMISCVKQNKIKEVRGILNGTTNYILTKMFSFGESFSSALSDAQAKGFAEKDPTADIEGIDAMRKIAILGALATEDLVPTDKIHAEGITKILASDVANADKAGFKIKLLGRCIVEDDGIFIMVAPFMIPEDKTLATINGVYNAVEVVGEPIENVIFYGPGAGSGATASAVVGDLMEIMRSGINYAAPKMTKTDRCVKPFDSFVCRHYVAVSDSARDKINNAFGDVQFLNSEGTLAFITEKISEADIKSKLDELGCKVESRIRVLN